LRRDGQFGPWAAWLGITDGDIPLTVLAPVYLWVALKISKSRLASRDVFLFLVIGALLAVIRVGWFWYLSQRMMTHTWNASLSTLSQFLILLYSEAPVTSALGGIDPFWDLVISSIIFAVGSFLWASPLLLVRARPRSDLP
jgi:hypothetical protein